MGVVRIRNVGEDESVPKGSFHEFSMIESLAEGNTRADRCTLEPDVEAAVGEDSRRLRPELR